MVDRPEIIDYPGVVVVGVGFAGVMTALRLAPAPTLLVGAGEGCSHYAQGGIAAAVGDADSPELHAKDTLAASCGLNDILTVETVTRAGAAAVVRLEKLGVVFDHKNGEKLLGREAAHSVERILHCNADASGAGIMRALWRRVAQATHVRILSPAQARRLLVENGRVRGIRLHLGGRDLELRANAVVLATGGLGQLFERTTNPQGVCGNGVGMALRAGATVVDMEFVQFHPTAFDLPHVSPDPLATEALRGRGAVLLDNRGRRFMVGLHSRAELAPRDVVARAVYRSVRKTGNAYLDATEALGSAFPDHFPTVFRLAQAHGIDPRREPIPVAPAAHYHMGGVAVDGRGRSSLPGLWAVGEVASTGLHGANRLAGNSLLEVAVYAPIVAKNIRMALGDGVAANLPEAPESRAAATQAAPGWLRSIMYAHAGLVRDAAGLTQALGQVGRWQPMNDGEANMKAAAQAVLVAATQRRESRGCHYRRDYPSSDDAQEQRRFLTLEEIETFGATATRPAEERIPTHI